MDNELFTTARPSVLSMAEIFSISVSIAFFAFVMIQTVVLGATALAIVL